MIWVDLYRTGVADVEYRLDNEKKIMTVNFEYQDDFDLLLEEV